MLFCREVTNIIHLEFKIARFYFTNLILNYTFDGKITEDRPGLVLEPGKESLIRATQISYYKKHRNDLFDFLYLGELEDFSY